MNAFSGMGMSRFLSIRSDFPMLTQKVHGNPFIYFDSAATAQKPWAVIEAIRRFYAEEYGTVHRAVYHYAAQASHRYEGVREQVAAFLCAAHADEIVFTRGTTDALNLVARSFGQAFLKAGDEVMVAETEHHSNIIPWQMLAEQKGICLVRIPVDEDGVILLDRFSELLSERTKLVSLAHVSNFTGAEQPIEQITALAHAQGAYILIDAAQSAPHMPLDVQALDVDFLAFSGHKAFGPTGIGVLYGKRDLLAKMPPVQGGGDMIDRVLWEGSTYRAAPLKFEAGTPMIAEVMGLGAALQYLDQLDRKEVQAYEEQLLQVAMQKLTAIKGLQIVGNANKITHQRGAIISFVVSGCHPLDIGTLLDLQGIAIRTGHHCAQTALQRFGVTSTARISFAPYNTFEEIDLFIDQLLPILDMLS